MAPTACTWSYHCSSAVFDGKWHPSKTALEQWGKYVHVGQRPCVGTRRSRQGSRLNGGCGDAGANRLPEAVRRGPANPARARSADAEDDVPRRRVAISIMYQIPVDGTMTPSHIQYLQPSPAAQAQPAGSQPGAPSPGLPAFTGPLVTGQQTMPSLDRRAGA